MAFSKLGLVGCHFIYHGNIIEITKGRFIRVDVLLISVLYFLFSCVLAVSSVRNVVVPLRETPLTNSGRMGLRCAQHVVKTGTKAIIALCVKSVILMKILNLK